MVFTSSSVEHPCVEDVLPQYIALARRRVIPLLRTPAVSTPKPPKWPFGHGPPRPHITFRPRGFSPPRRFSTHQTRGFIAPRYRTWGCERFRLPPGHTASQWLAVSSDGGLPPSPVLPSKTSPHTVARCHHRRSSLLPLDSLVWPLSAEAGTSWIADDAPFAPGWLVKLRFSSPPVVDHVSSAEWPKSLAGRPPRPPVVSFRSTTAEALPSCPSQGDAAPERVIRSDRLSDLPTPRASGHRLPPPVLSVRWLEMSTRFRHASRGSRADEPSRGFPRSDSPRPSSQSPQAALASVRSCPQLQGLLCVWVGVDSVPLPVRNRPILPWVFNSPSRCIMSLDSRSPWPVSSARAAE